jgi:hypothetical protein
MAGLATLKDGRSHPRPAQARRMSRGLGPAIAHVHRAVSQLDVQIPKKVMYIAHHPVADIAQDISSRARIAHQSLGDPPWRPC